MKLLLAPFSTELLLFLCIYRLAWIDGFIFVYFTILFSTKIVSKLRSGWWSIVVVHLRLLTVIDSLDFYITTPWKFTTMEGKKRNVYCQLLSGRSCDMRENIKSGRLQVLCFIFLVNLLSQANPRHTALVCLFCGPLFVCFLQLSHCFSSLAYSAWLAG